MSVTYKDYYDILGVARDATPEQIRKAYRTLARKYHPDVNKSDTDAEDKFKDINEAYEVLKDPEKRSRYDQLGANWKQGQEFRPPPGFESFTFNFGQGGARGFEASGFSDFFDMLFGMGGPGAGGRGTHRTGPRPGMGGFGGFHDFTSGFEAGPGAMDNDVEAEIDVPLEKVLQGGKMSFRLSIPGHPPKSYEVRIPKGIAEGRRIRLAGQGRDGGDLFLKIRYAKGGTYEIDGRNVTTTVRVSPWEAALGAKVPVETPEGRIQLTIPPGSSSGRQMRLRGHGLPKEGAKPGDLLVRIMVSVPENLTKEEKELLEKLSRISPFDPRA